MKGYKTVIFNLLMMVIGVIAVLNPHAQLPAGADVQSAIDASAVAYSAVWGIGNLILRAVTDTPIFKGNADAGS